MFFNTHAQRQEQESKLNQLHGQCNLVRKRHFISHWSLFTKFRWKFADQFYRLYVFYWEIFTTQLHPIDRQLVKQDARKFRKHFWDLLALEYAHIWVRPTRSPRFRVNKRRTAKAGEIRLKEMTSSFGAIALDKYFYCIFVFKSLLFQTSQVGGLWYFLYDLVEVIRHAMEDGLSHFIYIGHHFPERFGDPVNRLIYFGNGGLDSLKGKALLHDHI